MAAAADPRNWRTLDIPQPQVMVEQPPDADMLKQIQAALDCPATDMVRAKEAPFKENGLESATENELFDAIAQFPILLERPIVVNGSRAAIGRPPENVLEIL